MKVFGSKVFEFENETLVLFSSCWKSAVYTMKFHSLSQLLKYTRSSGDLSILEESVYEQFSTHIKRAYRWSSRRQSTYMQETVGKWNGDKGSKH